MYKMETIKILFVEDNETPIRTFNNELKDFNDENTTLKIEAVVKTTYDEAIQGRVKVLMQLSWT